MSAGPTGFPADPREQPHWCNTSAGPLENPMIQCLPPPYPAAEDMSIGTWQNSAWMDGWMVPTLCSWKQERTFLTSHWGKENGPIFPPVVAGMALDVRTPVFQVSWRPRRAVCFQVFAHSHPAPPCSALIKVTVGPLLISCLKHST